MLVRFSTKMSISSTKLTLQCNITLTLNSFFSSILCIFNISTNDISDKHLFITFGALLPLLVAVVSEFDNGFDRREGLDLLRFGIVVSSDNVEGAGVRIK